MHLNLSKLTKFQLSSTSGSIIARGLNLAVFPKKTIVFSTQGFIYLEKTNDFFTENGDSKMAIKTVS